MSSSACKGLVSPSPKNLTAGAAHRGEEFSGLIHSPMKDVALALASLLFHGNIVSIYL